jgi:hypothetical protein
LIKIGKVTVSVSCFSETYVTVILRKTLTEEETYSLRIVECKTCGRIGGNRFIALWLVHCALYELLTWKRGCQLPEG